jgi:hypothetical protein
MTIHWKALEEHFLILVFRYNHLGVHFLYISNKNSVLEELRHRGIC